MRLFTAIDLPPEGVRRLDQLIASLQAQRPPALEPRP